jgi:C1A family cysteine protease
MLKRSNIIASIAVFSSLALASGPFSFGAVLAWAANEPAEPIWEELPEIEVLSEEDAEVLGLAAEEPELNPDYIRWLSGEDFGGLIPRKYPFTRPPAYDVPGMLTSSPNEIKYDPRDDDPAVNALTPAKNQGSIGTCWAFSAIGALESFAEKTGVGDTDPDFSEQHMRYATGADLIGGNPYSFRPSNDYGGNSDIAMAYFTRNPMSGPVAESDDPYNTSKTARDANVISATTRAGIVTGTAELADLSAGTPGSETSGSYKEQIKTLVAAYGAATVAYYSSQTTSSDGTGGGYGKINSGAYQNQYAYHYSGANGANHGVLIIGWDDDFSASNFETEPIGNGAWLIKNSWSASEDDESYRSYFWMSYYTPINGVYAITGYDDDFTEAIYDYSPNYTPRAYGRPGNTIYSANIFDCTDASAALTKVQVYNNNGASDYTVHVAVGNTSNTTDKTILAQALTNPPVAIGSFTHNGYHTVDLLESIPLGTGKTFAIVLKTTIDGVEVNTTYSGTDVETGGNVGYYSSDGLTWIGGEPNGVCAIRAIVSGGSGWTCRPRLADNIAPIMAVRSPSGTISGYGGDLVLGFSETVIPVVGKKIMIFCLPKKFVYDGAGNATPVRNGNHGIKSPICTISEGIVAVGSDADCTVSIPLSKFNLSKGVGFYVAFVVCVETGAFRDAAGNTVSDILKTNIDGTEYITFFDAFFGKWATKPAIADVAPANKATDVPVDGDIAIGFDTQMDKTVQGFVQLGSSAPLPAGAWSADGKTYTVAYTGLVEGRSYKIDIGGFKDPDGNEMDENAAYSFRAFGALPYVLGDASGDETVNMADATLVYRHHRGKIQLEGNDLLAADVDENNAVNMADATLVYRYHRGKISFFPANEN